MQLKILTIVYDLDVGGTQRAAQNFAAAYFKEGHDSRVLPVYGAGPRKKELEDLGVHVYDHGELIERSLESINEWKPDIVHIHRAGGTDPVLAKILRALKNGETKIIETNVFSVADNSGDADLIDVHCHLSEWCLWKWNTFLERKSFGIVVPYLVLPEHFYKEQDDVIAVTKKKLGLPLDKFIFGRIGQQSPAKFHSEIYFSFDRLYTQNKKIHLLMVGLPPHLKKEIESLSSFKEGAITLVDKIQGDENLRRAYNVMDCFLHFSAIGESFGMVLAEAQLCEVPVITVSTPKSDNSQLEVLVHNKTAVIVKDKKNLVEIMKQFSEKKYNLESFGKKGREHILSKFTPQVLIPQMNLLFVALKENKSKEFIAGHFKSNLKKVSIEHLKDIGHGSYSLPTKMFLLVPKPYLKTSHLAYVVTSLAKKIAKGASR